MKSFVRATNLTNIVGRADYISNPDRQENIVAKSAPVDWEPYQKYEQNNQKTYKKNNEGREVIVALPNEWQHLPSADLHERAQRLAEAAVGKSTDLQWAVHWNKGYTNLHMHVVFSERQKTDEFGRWDRDIYLTDDGKVARRKADRTKNPDGTDKPPVHRKGEEKGGFTSKNPMYSQKSWASVMKEKLAQEFASLGVVLDGPQPLHEYHEGKGKDAPKIREKNDVIRAVNVRLKDLADFGDRMERRVLPAIKKHMKDHKLVIPYFQGGQAKLISFSTPKKAVDFIQQTESEWQQTMSRYRQPEHTVTTVTPREPRQSERLQEALQAFLSVYRQRMGALDKINACKPWEWKKKKSFEDEFRSFARECNEKFEAIVSYGVSPARYGFRLTGADLRRGELDDFVERVNHRMAELQQEERPATAAEKDTRRQTMADYNREIAREKEADQRDNQHPVRNKSKSRDDGPVL